MGKIIFSYCPDSSDWCFHVTLPTLLQAITAIYPLWLYTFHSIKGAKAFWSAPRHSKSWCMLPDVHDKFDALYI